jgi:hypothetical protein
MVGAGAAKRCAVASAPATTSMMCHLLQLRNNLRIFFNNLDGLLCAADQFLLLHIPDFTLILLLGLCLVMFGLHPIHALAVLIDCAMGAWLGHDGFQVSVSNLLIFFNKNLSD